MAKKNSVEMVKELKNAREAAELDRNRLLKLLETMPSGVIVIEKPDGRVTYVNQMVIKLFGFDPRGIEMKQRASILGLFRTNGELYSPEELPLSRSFSRGEIVHGEEVYIKRADGTQVLISASTTPLYDNNRSLYAAIGVFDDITERKRAEEALRESEERFRQIAESAGAWIWEVDKEGIYRYSSPYVERILGYTPDELVGKMHFYDFFPAEMRDELKTEVFRAFGNKQPLQGYLNPDICKDGRLVILDTSGTPILDDKGNFRGYRGVDVDITKHKQAEEVLKKTEENFRNSLDDLPLGVRIVNNADETIYANRALLDIYGYAGIEELKATSAKERFTPGSYAQYLARKRKRENNEFVSPRFEISVIRKNGEIRHLEVFRKEVLWNRHVQFQLLYHDITERKRAEEKILLNEKHLQYLLDLHRMKDRTENSLMEHVLQASIKSLQSEFAFIGLMSPDEARMVIHAWSKEAMKKCAVTEKPLHFPITEAGLWGEAVRQRRPVIVNDYAGSSQKRGYPDGHVPIKCFLSVPVFSAGKIVAVAAVANKVSGYDDADINILTSLLNEMWNLVESKQAEHNKMEFERKAQNASRLAAIGEMAAGIAHEINNPLTPILGFTEMLLMRDLPEDVKSDLKIIYNSTRRAAEVTRRLLTFARQSKPMRSLCSINEVIESALQLRAYHLKTSGTRVTIGLDPEVPPTVADAGQLQQVFLNLIMNAEYEMEQAQGSGNLLIKTEKTGDIIRISVIDNGPGISKDNMDKLFTPFFTTKKGNEGTGLGLSVCHGIIAEHNGRIYAESREGKGATFIIELPIIMSHPQENESEIPEPDWHEAGETGKTRILVVDDEPSIVQILKRVLSGQGYEVNTTGKAKEALKMAGNGKYECILLDIKLPDMSGIELYQHLEGMDKSSAQKIIFITGDVIGSDTSEFFSRTGVTHIAKPFDIEDLKKEIKNKLTSIV